MSASDWFCPLPLDCSDTYGRLTINAASLHTPAWCAFDLSSLYDSPEFRGESVLVERLNGRQARPILSDETVYSLPMKFSGATNSAGISYSSPAGGLLANQRAFTSTSITPIRTGTSTLAATLQVPNPADPEGMLSFTFAAQPLRLFGWTLLPNAYARTVLELRVPVPTFAPVGP